MKKVLFAIPALALTLLFTFCQKAEPSETVAQATPESGAANRGACSIEIYPDNYTSVLRTCGLGTSNVNCNTCQSSTFTSGVSVFNSDITLTAPSLPITFSIQNTSNSGANLTLITNADQDVVWVPAFGCREITINDNCEIQ